MLLYFVKCHTAVLTETYTTLEELSSPIASPLKVCCASNHPNSFETTTLDQLEALALGAFPGEEVLKKESVRVLRNLVFNTAVKFIENHDPNDGVARYTSTN